MSLLAFSFALVYAFYNVLTKDVLTRSTLLVAFSGALGNSYFCNLWLEITFSPAKVYGLFLAFFSFLFIFYLLFLVFILVISTVFMLA